MKKIILLTIIILVVIIGAAYLFTNNHKTTPVNNTTNITSNATLNVTNVTGDNETTNEGSSNHQSSSESDPAYGSDDYVRRWDRSQQNGGDWAYTHDQPVRTDSDGNSYARVYHEDTGQSSWESMNGPSDDK